MAAYTYHVFGLYIRFPREVATLRPARIEDVVQPDVEVTFGPVPRVALTETVNGDLGVAWDGRALTVAVDEVGWFLVRDGATIVADADPQASEAEVDLYLAGSIMGALLHQRGILPLHCNAFVLDGSAVLLCGDSGAGKSTLAAWFEARGYPLLTDDVCAVTFGPDGQMFGHPGMPRLRLWADALESMSREAQEGRPVPWAEGKFELEMTSARASQSVPLAAIYHLRETDENAQISRLPGILAVDAITSSIYRRRLCDVMGGSGYYLNKSIILSKHVPIYAVYRKWGMEFFACEAQSIESHAIKIGTGLTAVN